MNIFLLFLTTVSVIAAVISVLVITATIYSFLNLHPALQKHADLSGVMKWFLLLAICVAWWVARIFA